MTNIRHTITYSYSTACCTRLGNTAYTDRK